MRSKVLAQRGKDFWEEVIFRSLLALTFVVPLIVYPFAYDGFELPKVTFLRVMTIFLFVLWVAGALLHREARIKTTRLDKYLLLFLATLVLSTVLSVHPATSLLGSYFRYEGLLTFLSYGFLFFLGVQVFSGERLRTLAVVVTCTASLAAVYGVAQYLGYDPFAWLQVELYRSVSTFGNSVFFGAFLVLTFPISLCVFLESSSRSANLLSGTGLFLIFFALVTTFSRGAWVALLAGVVFLVVILWGTPVNRRKVWAVALMMILIITSVELISLTVVPSYDVAYRAASSANLQGSSIKQRIEVWKIALEGIKERPLLGYGPDSFTFLFHRFQTVEYLRDFFKVERPYGRVDNAHNYFVQLSATAGIPAAFLFFIFLLRFLTSTVRSMRTKGDNRVLKGGFLAGIVSYTVALLFGIGAIGAATLSWIFLGSVASESSKHMKLKWSKGSKIPRAVVAISIALAGVILSFLALRLMVADAHFARARNLMDRKAFAPAAREFDKAIALNPWEGWYRNGLGLNYFNWAQEDERAERALLQAAAFQTERAKIVSPAMFDNYLVLGNIYRFSGMRFDRKHYGLAEKNLAEAIKLSPNSPDAHYLLGFVYLLEDDSRADYELDKAKRLSQSYEPVYMSLGDYFESRGEIEMARKMYRRALEQEPGEAKEALQRLEGKN